MLKRAPTSLAAYLFVTVALAKNFPLRERLLSRYGGKSDQTPVPLMKMGSQMQMSLGTPANATTPPEFACQSPNPNVRSHPHYADRRT